MQSIAIEDAIHPLVLTLDVGTSAVRLLCFDALARQITDIEARRPIDVYSDAHGAAEVDIKKLHLQCDAVIDAVIGQLGAHVQFVAAIGVDTMATTMVGIASDGTPVGPLRTYADTQSAGAAQLLRQQYDEIAYHGATGCLLRPNYWPARVRWLQTQRPPRMADGKHVDDPWRISRMALAGDSACDTEYRRLDGVVGPYHVGLAS